VVECTHTHTWWKAAGSLCCLDSRVCFSADAAHGSRPDCEERSVPFDIAAGSKEGGGKRMEELSAGGKEKVKKRIGWPGGAQVRGLGWGWWQRQWQRQRGRSTTWKR
jgi:hypothetical protein